MFPLPHRQLFHTRLLPTNYYKKNIFLGDSSCEKKSGECEKKSDYVNFPIEFGFVSCENIRKKIEHLNKKRLFIDDFCSVCIILLNYHRLILPLARTKNDKKIWSPNFSGIPCYCNTYYHFDMRKSRISCKNNITKIINEYLEFLVSEILNEFVNKDISKIITKYYFEYL